MRSEETLVDLFYSGDKSDRLAVESSSGSVSLTYRQLNELISKVQGKVRAHEYSVQSPGKVARDMGDVPKVVISLSLPNSVEYVVAFMAVCNLGYAAAPLNPKYASSEIRFYVSDANSQMLIIPAGTFATHPGVSVARELGMSVYEISITHPTTSGNSAAKATVHFRQCLANAAEKWRPISPNAISKGVNPDSVALILHTSGTTSRPKCVPLTHRNICKTLQNVSNTYQLTSNDKSLVVMPLFHVHGLIGALLSTLYSGGSAVVMPFSASSFWDTFVRRGCTWYSAVPTIHQMLLAREQQQKQQQYPPSPTTASLAKTRRRRGNLRFIRSCSAALAPAVLRQLEEVYGVPVLEAYAMTEASHQMTSNPQLPGQRKPGSVGLPQGVQVGILDDKGKVVVLAGSGRQGEVCIKGENVTRGYLNRPDANKENFTGDGWFRTGDRGYFDSEGYLFLTGRLKELINRGGEKISPLEIDAVLLEHPAVSEAVAYGVKDEVFGEEVNAAVVLKQSSSKKVTAKELSAFCATKLAPFKVPKVIHIAPSVPKTATGKIQRRIVAEHFSVKAKNKL